eukprot:612153-Rhodomonas_salina.1
MPWMTGHAAVLCLWGCASLYPDPPPPEFDNFVAALSRHLASLPPLCVQLSVGVYRTCCWSWSLCRCRCLCRCRGWWCSCWQCGGVGLGSRGVIL